MTNAPAEGMTWSCFRTTPATRSTRLWLQRWLAADVVTWDSPIPSGVANRSSSHRSTSLKPVSDGGWHSILGEDGGKFAVLSATPDAANQNAWIASLEEVLATDAYANLELLDIVYGNDESEESYNQALALVDKYSGHGADHGSDVGRYRRGCQGDAGRRSLRPGQGFRSRTA
ncbi:MAG: hypothetical protein R2855_04635 [Thermomicrobiales bacterium]